jgi:hypothetical protein
VKKLFSYDKHKANSHIIIHIISDRWEVKTLGLHWMNTQSVLGPAIHCYYAHEEKITYKVKCKISVSNYLTTVEIYGGGGGIAPPFLTWELGGGEWSGSRPYIEFIYIHGAKTTLIRDRAKNTSEGRTWQLRQLDWEVHTIYTILKSLQNESKCIDNWMKKRQPPSKFIDILVKLYLSLTISCDF